MAEYLLKNAQGQAITVSGKEVHLNEMENRLVNFMRNETSRFTNSDPGFDQILSTITAISAHISKQKFYQVPNLSDYIDFEIGVGTYMQEVGTWRTYTLGQSFESGNVAMSSANGKLSSVETSLDFVRTPIQNWALSLNYSLWELKQTDQTKVFSYVSSLESARKKCFDLGLQEVVFLGTKNGGRGLLNFTEIQPDTTTITKPFTSMTATEVNNFVGSVAKAWYERCDYSAIPNRFVMPLDDFAGLSAFTDPSFPLVTKFDALDKAFKAQFGQNFRILPIAYANKTKNGLGGSTNRYALYNADIETVKQLVPLPYTSLQLSSIDGYQYTSVATAQYGNGATLLKPAEFIYFDCNA